ncbi:MAG: hypothetical protein FWG50_04380 [Kiritimatiellaeota bacterium]|nr:hypothetical protein [Kiritimatiellota bacterium]
MKTAKLRILLLTAFILHGMLIAALIMYFSRTPSKRNPDAITQIMMSHMVYPMHRVMGKAGHSNLVEYVDSLTGSRGIPRFVHREMIQEMSPRSGNFLDAWGQPIMILLTTNSNGEAGVAMHSFGGNKRDEGGGGDDIVLWIDAVWRGREVFIIKGKTRVAFYEEGRHSSEVEMDEPIFKIDLLGEQWN